jgi:hypothetical protein
VLKLQCFWSCSGVSPLCAPERSKNKPRFVLALVYLGGSDDLAGICLGFLWHSVYVFCIYFTCRARSARDLGNDFVRHLPLRRGSELARAWKFLFLVGVARSDLGIGVPSRWTRFRSVEFPQCALVRMVTLFNAFWVNGHLTGTTYWTRCPIPPLIPSRGLNEHGIYIINHAAWNMIVAFHLDQPLL